MNFPDRQLSAALRGDLRDAGAYLQAGRTTEGYDTRARERKSKAPFLEGR